MKLLEMFRFRKGEGHDRTESREPESMTEQKTGLDFEAMRRAIEGKDAGVLIGLYDEDAEIQVVNRNATPSAPFVLRGREAIAGHCRDVCGRAMTHRIESEVVGEDRVAFNETCEYPDGARVLCAAMTEVKGGRIFRQVNVEVWDE